MSHYAAERVFRPTLVSPIVDASGVNLEIHVATDSLEDLEDTRLVIQAVRFAMQEGEVPYDVVYATGIGHFVGVLKKHINPILKMLCCPEI